MKKVLSILMVVMFLAVSVSSYAGNFNYGRDTYEMHDSRLIINSLGDETAVSKHGNLGANDWIPENAVKNSLALDGYTKAYDYNPQAQYGYNVYHNALPTGADLKKLEFKGMYGDPRAKQDVYVLQSEYDKYSAQSQDARINVNKIDIEKEAQQRQQKDTVLNKRIKKVDKKHTIQNKRQDKDITKNGKRIDKNVSAIAQERNNRVKADKKLKKNIAKETKKRKRADKRLKRSINKETVQRKSADKKLNKEINKVDINSKKRDKALDKKHSKWNKTQDKKIEKNTKGIAKNKNAITAEKRQRKTEDRNINKRITKETNQRKVADKKINRRVTKETSQRKAGDRKLGKRITKETSQRKTADRFLNKKIKKETRQRKVADKKLSRRITRNVADIFTNKTDIANNETNINKNIQMLQQHDSRIGANESNIADNSSRISSLDSRVNELEETAIGVHAEVDLYDSRFVKLGVFAEHDVRHSRLDNVMAKMTFKPFKSYELKRLEKLEQRLGVYESEQLNRVESAALKLVEVFNSDGTITIKREV